MSFPSDFIWGAATASYQIEGSVRADGRKPSIWDVFSATPGKTFNSDSGEIACDHYNRWKDDIALMKELGLQSYRFSLAWPRIIPDGRGKINPAGLDFYSRLVDGLLEAGIRPWATLYHWDLPYDLHRQGGWINPAISDAFAEYALAVAEVLGDRVTDWMTFNEPQCILGLGYEAGVHAPGLKAPVQDLMYGLHNHLVAHGKAVDALRSVGGGVFNIGYVPTAQSFIPVNDSPEEVEAAKNAFFSYKPRHGHMWSMAMYTDPVFFGTYPEDFISQMGSHLPPNWEKDLPGIGGKTDFCGINLYSGFRVKKTETGIEPVPVPSGREQTAIKWYVEPETLRWAPRFLSERYGKPVIITENGLSLSDWVHVDGKVHDPARIDFTTRYLRELEKAIGDGANIAGYFHWSLMDNFEWAEGYRERFGLIHVDLQTQKRTIKDSGYWYKSVIESNGKILHD
ncbi:MAG TPA: GH1 family beta-glucosidase [Treponemataceae bacterium]|nr:GH1 family beta-glucosidase [Treponemataceae bacterium]